MRCKPPDDVQPYVPNNNTGIILSIIPVIILVIIYYSSSIEIGVMHEKKNFFDINFDWLKFGI